MPSSSVYSGGASFPSCFSKETQSGETVVKRGSGGQREQFLKALLRRVITPLSGHSTTRQTLQPARRRLPLECTRHRRWRSPDDTGWGRHRREGGPALGLVQNHLILGTVKGLEASRMWPGPFSLPPRGIPGHWHGLTPNSSSAPVDVFC